MLSEYLKPEFKDSVIAKTLEQLYQNQNGEFRYVLKVPVDVGEEVTTFLRQATNPEYRFWRRNGGGPRRDSMHQTCLREDATHFRYYFEPKSYRDRRAMYVAPTPKFCQCCGHQL